LHPAVSYKLDCETGTGFERRGLFSIAGHLTRAGHMSGSASM
jgi:hypothetical protein